MKNLKYVLFTFVICFISLSNVSAGAVCSYNNGNETIKCTINNNVECSYNGPFKYNAEDVKINLSADDFEDKNGNIDCDEVDELYIHLSTVGKISKITNKGSCSVGHVNQSPTCTTFELSSKNTSNNSSTTNNSGDNNIANNNSNKSDLDLKHFCKGPVLGAFTALGWVFFILKILVPLIIIIFGSIDYFKAILAGQSDEVKKATKSLILRIIAGILIFFVPTMIKFVVSLVDNDNIYEGTFMDCTKCMIDPSPNAKDDYTCNGLGD